MKIRGKEAGHFGETSRKHHQAASPDASSKDTDVLDRLLPLRLHLEGKVNHRHFVLVLKQAPQQQRHVGVSVTDEISRHILDLNGDVVPLLDQKSLILRDECETGEKDG